MYEYNNNNLNNSWADYNASAENLKQQNWSLLIKWEADFIFSIEIFL